MLRSDVRIKALWFVIAAAAALLRVPSLACAAQPPSLTSQEAFLTPQVHRGETLVWTTRETDYAGRRTGYQIQCKVLSVNKPEYLIEWYPYNINPGWGTYSSVKFTLRQGVASPLQGTMQGEPCAFFLVRGYGTPPALLRAGTSWRFVNPATGLLSGFRGTVTVTNLDPRLRSIRLHLTYIRSGMVDEYSASNGQGWQHFQRYRRDAGAIDVTVARGGVILDRVIHVTGQRGGSHTTLSL